MNIISGIYKIENMINGMIYIGQSRDILKRFECHKRELRQKRHHSNKLQMDYDKYGEKYLSYSILEICEIVDLKQKEREYIVAYNSIDYGYNYGDDFEKINNIQKDIINFYKKYCNGRYIVTTNISAIADLIGITETQFIKEVTQFSYSLMRIENVYIAFDKVDKDILIMCELNISNQKLNNPNNIIFNGGCIKII